MKKIMLLFIFVFLFYFYGFAQTTGSERTFTVEVTNIAVNGGKVYLAIFANAEEFKKEDPRIAFELPDTRASAVQEVTLPYGDYVVSAFQDANGNKQLDYNFLGVPKELVGISNYEGRGLPSKNFDKQKIPVNASTTRIIIGLYRF